jgi:hypothetical protein
MERKRRIKIYNENSTNSNTNKHNNNKFGSKIIMIDFDNNKKDYFYDENDRRCDPRECNICVGNKCMDKWAQKMQRRKKRCSRFLI